MEKEFWKKICFVFLGFLMFVAFTVLSDLSATGYFLKTSFSETQFQLGFIISVLGIVVVFFLLINRGNIKEVIKSIIGAVAIAIGLLTIAKLVPRIELTVGLISFTFGIMALQWVLRARNRLSFGSSLRSYTTTFFFSLLLLLTSSLYEIAVNILQLETTYTYVKHLLVTFSYLLFVYSAYKIMKIGSEFGFSDSSLTIHREIKRVNAKTGKARTANSQLYTLSKKTTKSS